MARIQLMILTLVITVIVTLACNCPPGKYLEKASPCTCVPCPNDTYMDTINSKNACIPCTKTCNEKSKIILAQCTRFRDSECGCPAGQYFDKGLLFCMACDICEKGNGAAIRCSTASNTVCRACIAGKTYSTSESMSPCKNCTPCAKGSEIRKECNITSDTICEPIAYNSTQTTPTRESISPTHSNGSHLNGASKNDDFLIPTLAIVFILIVIVLVGICFYCFIHHKRQNGTEQPINDDLEDKGECEVIELDPKPPAVHSRHSGLRGRHTRQPRRIADRSSSRKPFAGDSDGNTEPELPSLSLSDKLLRDVPFDVMEKLGLMLNPKSLNNWVTLAGHLNYTKENIDYFGMEPDNATQRMLSDWQTSNSSTIRVLHRHLKMMKRDDAAEVLETVA